MNRGLHDIRISNVWYWDRIILSSTQTLAFMSAKFSRILYHIRVSPQEISFTTCVVLAEVRNHAQCVWVGGSYYFCQINQEMFLKHSTFTTNKYSLNKIFPNYVYFNQICTYTELKKKVTHTFKSEKKNIASYFLLPNRFVFETEQSREKKTES